MGFSLLQVRSNISAASGDIIEQENQRKTDSLLSIVFFFSPFAFTWGLNLFDIVPSNVLGLIDQNIGLFPYTDQDFRTNPCAIFVISSFALFQALTIYQYTVGSIPPAKSNVVNSVKDYCAYCTAGTFVSFFVSYLVIPNVWYAFIFNYVQCFALNTFYNFDYGVFKVKSDDIKSFASGQKPASLEDVDINDAIRSIAGTLSKNENGWKGSITFKRQVSNQVYSTLAQLDGFRVLANLCYLGIWRNLLQTFVNLVLVPASLIIQFFTEEALNKSERIKSFFTSALIVLLIAAVIVVTNVVTTSQLPQMPNLKGIVGVYNLVSSTVTKSISLLQIITSRSYDLIFTPFERFSYS